MNILFKNIPIGITGYDLAEFIESEFNMDSIESKKLSVTVCCIEMMERQDHFCHLVEQYGIVRISPPDLAKKVIRRLDGRFFDRLPISVRKYYIRSAGNDPRLNLIDTPEMIMEKRTKDRRQHSLIYSRQI